MKTQKRFSALFITYALPIFLLVSNAFICNQAWAVGVTPQPTDDPALSQPWLTLRPRLFENRTFEKNGKEALSLSISERATDPAAVPVVIKSLLSQSTDHYVKRLYLIIDSNPTPVAAMIDLTPAAGRAEIETRVRIDDYSHIRAVAETNDNKLYMVTSFVKASGGCTAAADTSDASRPQLGKMDLRIFDHAPTVLLRQAQLSIVHPNDTGMVMNQASRLYTPAFFIRKIDVTYDNQPIFSANLDFAISQNPSIRFFFHYKRHGSLKAVAEDTSGQLYGIVQSVSGVNFVRD